MTAGLRTGATIAAAAIIAVMIFSISCDTPEFDPPNRIKSLRILAVKSEPREVSPGEEVIISGLAVNEDGTIYTGPIAWVLGSTGALTGAERSEASEEDVEGVMHIQMTEDDPFVYTMPTGGEFDEKFEEYNADGTVLTIGMGIGDLDNPIMSIKSLMVRDNTSFENPVFVGLDFLVEGRYVLPDEDGVFNVGNTEAVKVTANVDFPTGDEKTFHWFTATKGLKEFTVDKAIEWKLPKESGIYDIYCVARENTGTQFGDGDYNVKSAGVDWGAARIRVSETMDDVIWADGN